MKSHVNFCCCVKYENKRILAVTNLCFVDFLRNGKSYVLINLSRKRNYFRRILITNARILLFKESDSFRVVNLSRLGNSNYFTKKYYFICLQCRNDE